MQLNWQLLNEAAVHLGAAVIAGGAIGAERTYHGRAAGFRTHALVCVASAMLMMLPQYQAAWLAAAGETIRIDPTRMAQGIMTGIGFLGAGVILHRDTKKRIEGLTTAASIWVAAAFGMACGAGLFILVAITLTAALLVLVLGGPLEKWLERVFAPKPDDLKDDPPTP